MSDADNTEKLDFEQRMTEQFGLVKGRLSKLDEIPGQLSLVNGQLSKLEGTLEDYFSETCLAWEQVLEEIMEVKNEVRTTGRRLDVLNTRDLIQAADILDLRVRLDRLEPDPNSPTNRLP